MTVYVLFSRLFRLRVIPTEMEGSDNVHIVLPDFRTHFTINVCIRSFDYPAYDITMFGTMAQVLHFNVMSTLIIFAKNVGIRNDIFETASSLSKSETSNSI
jgi:hypothetical protein